jgi:hypothetical protein
VLTLHVTYCLKANGEVRLFFVLVVVIYNVFLSVVLDGGQTRGDASPNNKTMDPGDYIPIL